VFFRRDESFELVVRQAPSALAKIYPVLLVRIDPAAGSGSGTRSHA
jgi:hypothetical protein